MDNPEGNENLIAYCGLYCGDCHGYQQKIPDLARDLRKELRQLKYKKFKEFEHSVGEGLNKKQLKEFCLKVLR